MIEVRSLTFGLKIGEEETFRGDVSPKPARAGHRDFPWRLPPDLAAHHLLTTSSTSNSHNAVQNNQCASSRHRNSRCIPRYIALLLFFYF